MAAKNCATLKEVIAAESNMADTVLWTCHGCNILMVNAVKALEWER